MRPQERAGRRASSSSTVDKRKARAKKEGTVLDLLPAGSAMSLIAPAERGDCTRATFCQQSLVFQAAQAASTFLADHPEAFILSVDDAPSVRRLLDQTCSMEAKSHTSNHHQFTTSSAS